MVCPEWAAVGDSEKKSPILSVITFFLFKFQHIFKKFHVFTYLIFFRPLTLLGANGHNIPLGWMAAHWSKKDQWQSPTQGEQRPSNFFSNLNDFIADFFGNLLTIKNHKFCSFGKKCSQRQKTDKWIAGMSDGIGDRHSFWANCYLNRFLWSTCEVELLLFVCLM